MDKRVFGRSGMKVSILGFGCGAAPAGIADHEHPVDLVAFGVGAVAVLPHQAQRFGFHQDTPTPPHGDTQRPSQPRHNKQMRTHDVTE